MRLERTVDIAAPPEAVFAILVDVERWPEWTSSVTEARKLDPGDLAIGSRVELAQPRLSRMTWTVTELEPGRGFAWTARSSGVRSVANHRIEPTASGSRVTLSVEQDGFMTWLMRPFIKRIGERYIEAEAEGLKRRAEGPAAAAD